NPSFCRDRNDVKVYQRIHAGLHRFAPDWRLLWGPATYSPITIFDENLMFLVQSKNDPARYALVVRGTNPVSFLNWILEDLAIVGQTPWPYGEQHCCRRDTPKISKGTARGLQALQSMRAANGVPGAGTDIYQFLASEVMRSVSPKMSISVTGHSL